MEWVSATAPSNIALIKYMGKVAASVGSSASAAGGNISTNASLSYTLDHLQTKVRVRWESGHPSPRVWRPLIEDGFHAPDLSAAGQERFLRHAERCLKRLGATAEGSLVVESANGFPSDCGLASSASSFAALTLAIARLVGRDTESLEARLELAELSREGSGSSCRSLFSPWSIWKATGAEPIEGLPRKGSIRHLAIIVDDEKKAVSSSEAHVRVTTSLLFRGRIERAEERLRLLVDHLRRASTSVHAWNRAAHLVWAESWDMHALFESSEPPFGYFVPGSVQALGTLRSVTEDLRSQFGADQFREPMVTMDAGPNVHVLLWDDANGASQMTETTVREIKSRLSSGIRVVDSKDFAGVQS